MSKGIRLSKEYGLNPAIDHCICCGKEMGIALFGDSYRDEHGRKAQAPIDVCTGNLCDACQAKLEAGHTIIIEVTDTCNEDKPQLTGRSFISSKPTPPDCAKIGYMRKSEFSQLVKDN